MAILAECPFCHRRQTAKSKKCMSKNGKGCNADLEKAKRSGKVKYWIAYRVPGGKQRFGKLTGENAASIEYARDADAKRKVQKRENRIFDIKPEAKMTFQESTDWYLGLEKVKALASYSTVQFYLKKFNSEFGKRIVNQIKPAEVENHQAKRKGEGMADATVDKEIGAAQIVVRKAFDNDLVGGDVLKALKVKKMLKANSNARDKILSPDQFGKMLNTEGLDWRIRGVLAMAFYTGMRRGEIFGLTWPKVDMNERVIRLDAEDTKDRERRLIPICGPLQAILEDIPRALHDDHVFFSQGNPFYSLREGLKKACSQAGVEYGREQSDGFIFHDLRHCFVTYMRKAGNQESVINAITGHSSPGMFNRYNRVDLEDMRMAINRMLVFLASVDQNVDQKGN